MAIEWNNRSNRVSLNSGSEKGSFEEHSDRMRMFRKSHASDGKSGVSRRDLVNAMWPVLVNNSIRDAGGSTGLTSTADWSALIPMGKIRASRLSSN